MSTGCGGLDCRNGKNNPSSPQNASAENTKKMIFSMRRTHSFNRIDQCLAVQVTDTASRSCEAVLVITETKLLQIKWTTFVKI